MSEGFKDSRAAMRREMLRNYKMLKVWKKSYQLCLEVYRLTKNSPTPGPMKMVCSEIRIVFSLHPKTYSISMSFHPRHITVCLTS
jgi:hypothetical protein